VSSSPIITGQASLLVKRNINFIFIQSVFFILKPCSNIVYLLQLSKRQLDSYGSPQAAPAVDTYGAPASQPCELKVSLYYFSVKGHFNCIFRLQVWHESLMVLSYWSEQEGCNFAASVSYWSTVLKSQKSGRVWESLIRFLFP
jgi:hypothetical protein